MKKLFSTAVLACWLIVGVVGLSVVTGCGPQGTDPPPEDVADPNLEQTEEYLQGERSY